MLRIISDLDVIALREYMGPASSTILTGISPVRRTATKPVRQLTAVLRTVQHRRLTRQH